MKGANKRMHSIPVRNDSPKTRKKVCQNAHLHYFTYKAPTFTSWGFVIRRCVKMRTFFFYAQSPDFHKQGLCYYLKILYL